MTDKLNNVLEIVHVDLPGGGVDGGGVSSRWQAEISLSTGECDSPGRPDSHHVLQVN